MNNVICNKMDEPRDCHSEVSQKEKDKYYMISESILKSRDMTLPTKVHLVKAMVFPVVKYGCESWAIKKAEC